MAIERQTPDPAQEVEDMQDMTTERSTEDIDNEIIEILEGLDEEGVQYQDDGSVILGEMEEEMGDVGFSENLAEVVSQSELSKIYIELTAAIENDKAARKDWEKTYTDGLKYLGMKFDDSRSEPFEGASGVIHPLLGESVTQFQAQAYKELLPAQGPVKTQVVGEYSAASEEQAQRVKEFMNYQIIHVMEEYDEDLDQMLFYLPLAGSAFKKVYYDENLQRPVSKFVAPEDLIVPYYTTDLESCPRITHVIKMPENEVRKLQAIGFYRDVRVSDGSDLSNASGVKEEIERLEGMEPSYDTGEVSNLYEVHCNLDLEGFEDVDEDGEYTEVKLPYIVTIDSNSENILAIRRNFEEDDPMKNKIEYFVHFKFLPGLGFYGFGLTHMIGGLSKASTSIVRQLLDAGTLSNLPAGFKSRGIRIRDDDQPFQPGEFRDVDAPGGNIKDQFQILPFKEPSATLYQLMGFVVQAGQKFAAITNMDTGNDMQNRAVGTTLALLERSTKVLSAIHKRLHAGQKKEFNLLAKVFGTYLPPIYPYSVYGADQAVKQTDFDDRVDVIPVADPNIMSMAQRVTLANENLKIAMSNPMMHNLREAYRRVYEALGTQDIDQLLIPQEKPMPKDPATENMESLYQKT